MRGVPCPVGCMSSGPGLHPSRVSRTIPVRCDNQKCLHEATDVLRKAKSFACENDCEVERKQTGCTDRYNEGMAGWREEGRVDGWIDRYVR